MTESGMTEEARVLEHFLDAQRAAVLAIVEGLEDQGLRTPVLPSGWTPLGLIEHLGHAERHWFQRVATGSAPALPWPAGASDDDDAAFASARPAAQVFAFYRDQCQQSNAVLASRPLSSPPAGKHGGEMEERPDTRRGRRVGGPRRRGRQPRRRDPRDHEGRGRYLRRVTVHRKSQPGG
jgi:hypothetical protein